jgi:hypothetical protein
MYGKQSQGLLRLLFFFSHQRKFFSLSLFLEEEEGKQKLINAAKKIEGEVQGAGRTGGWTDGK